MVLVDITCSIICKMVHTHGFDSCPFSNVQLNIVVSVIGMQPSI